MIDTSKLDDAEFTIEAALRGVDDIREGGSGEAVIQNLHRAIYEVQDATRPRDRVADAATLATRAG